MYRQYEVLYKAFDLFNEHYFDNELSPCVITLQKKRENNYGHFVAEPTWFNNKSDDETYEININPINMNREPEEILATLEHEICHYYCTLHNIKDVKSSGKHTIEYKNVCESHGLNCELDEDRGYNQTSLNDESIELVEDLIEEYKNDFWYMMVEKKPVKKTQFLYTCPNCGLKAHAKAEKNIVCGDCGVNLEMEEIEDEEMSD